MSATSGPPARDPLAQVAVALDTPDWETFKGWCRLFGPRVGVLKVGLEAYVRWGPTAAATASEHAAAVFLDLKLHDIPNTVAGAVAAVRRQGVHYLTVHAAGGPSMLAAAQEAAGDEVRLLAVTVLTHLDEGELTTLDLPGGSADRVERWASLAAESGLPGVVCSPLELEPLRHRHPEPFLLVSPGIRPAGLGGSDDQRRVATPRQAVDAGADLLVIGRPLTRAADPARALDELEQELAG